MYSITYNHPTLELQAKQLAEKFGLLFLGYTDYPENILCLTLDGLQLFSEKGKPWCVDFLKGRSHYRRLHGGGIKEILAKACGVKSHHKPSILDLTAGWGKDAFVLASLGCPITLVEKHPMVAALLEDGLKRLKASANIPAVQMNLHFDEALHFLRTQLSPQSLPDVIYIDPMHPSRNKSARVKKDMQLLQEWLPPESQPEKLLETALDYARERVVLKWPENAHFACKEKPAFTYKGNTVKFEIYKKYCFS